MNLPDIETARLRIRHFRLDDLNHVHHVLDSEFDQLTREQRAEWLQWSVLNHYQLARLYQPPYGDLAVVLKGNGHLIGSVGLVPAFGPFEQLPYFNSNPIAGARFTPQVGLFWIIDAAFRQQGYATEAARGLIGTAFKVLNLKHIIATTEYDNEASQAVMRRLGMRIEKNPFPDPSWFQVVGILEHPGLPG